MADISRNTTPAWQDPHLKDRGDYTEQDIQNIQEKGGILPDFTLDEAEETHLFARVAQALSKTLTRQGLAVRHEAKAAAEPMGYRLDEHAIAIDTRRPWKDIALDLACVCSIESGPCERVDVFHVSGRFWSTSACGEKRTPARPAWTSFPS